MEKQKTIPQLEAEKEENERKLSQLQHKKQQLENRITYYEKGDRRKRAHRLITRGAAIESVAPQTKDLSESAFYALPNRSLRCRTHKDCSRKPSVTMQEVIEYRTLSFSCDADQAQRGAVRRGCCRLSCRRKAA